MAKENLILKKEHYPYFQYQKATNQPSKGVIFFIHGYASNSSYHQLFTDQLTDYDYFAVELPGNDISPLYKKRDLKPISYAKMIVTLIQNLQLKNIHLIGHSMGGGIAMMVASLIPNQIKDLILVCPMNLLGTFDLYHFLFSFNPTTIKKAKKLANYLLYNHNLLNHELAPMVLNQMVKLNKDTRWNQFILKYEIIYFYNLILLSYYEKHVKCPTLLMVSKHDKCINAKRTIFNLKRKIKNLKIFEFYNSGHAPMLEESDLYYQTIIKFIESNK